MVEVEIAIVDMEAVPFEGVSVGQAPPAFINFESLLDHFVFSGLCETFLKKLEIAWVITVAAREMFDSMRKASETTKVTGPAVRAKPAQGPMREKLLKNLILTSVSPSSSSSSSGREYNHGYFHL